jgi:hypothetical protein
MEFRKKDSDLAKQIDNILSDMEQDPRSVRFLSHPNRNFAEFQRPYLARNCDMKSAKASLYFLSSA